MKFFLVKLKIVFLFILFSSSISLASEISPEAENILDQLYAKTEGIKSLSWEIESKSPSYTTNGYYKQGGFIRLQMEYSRDDYQLDYLITPEKSLSYITRMGEITEGTGMNIAFDTWFFLPLLDKNTLKNWGEVTTKKESIENKNYVVLEMSFKSTTQTRSNLNWNLRFYFDTEGLKLEKVEYIYGPGSTQILKVKDYERIGEYDFPVKMEMTNYSLSVVNIQINPNLSEDLFKLEDKNTLTYFSNYSEEEVNSKLSKNPDDPNLHYTLAKLFNYQKGGLPKAIQEYEKTIALKPNAKAAYFGLASAYLNAKQYDEAIKLYEELIAKFPGNKQSYLSSLMWAYQQAGRKEDAIKTTEEYIKENPNQANAYSTVANLYNNLKDYDKAIQLYRKAIELEQNADSKAQYLLQIGQIYTQQKKYEEAEKVYEEAKTKSKQEWVQQNANSQINELYRQMGKIDELINKYETKLKEEPENIEFVKQLAEIYSRERKYEKGVELYNKALKIEPENRNLLNQLASAYLNTKQYDEAIKLYEELTTKFPEDKQNYLSSLMRAYQQAGRNEDAIKTAEEYLKENPSQSYAYITTANLYQSLKNYDKAIELYRKAIELEEQVDNQANHLLQIGQIYTQQKKYEEAIEVYEEAKTKSKQEWVQQNANSQINELYRQMGKIDELINKYETKLKEEPENIEFVKQLAEIYSRERKYEKGVELYNKALKIEPENRNLLNQLASAYLNTKQYDEAIKLYEELIAKFPSSKGQYLQNLIQAYQQTGRNEDAIKTAEEYIKENPSQAHAYATTARLYNSLKDYDKAIEMYRKVIELEQNADSQAQHLMQIGQIYAQQKKYEKAEQAYEEAKTKSKQEWVQQNANNQITELYRQINSKIDIDSSLIQKELDSLIPIYNNIRMEMDTRIAKAVAYRNDNPNQSCYIVIGQLVLDGTGNIQSDVKTQMDILSGGYFVALVKDSARPLSFRMYGYKPLDVDLNAIIKQPFANIGTLHLSPLNLEEEASLVGKLVLDRNGNISNAKIYANFKQQDNTPCNCSSNSYGRYENLNYKQSPIRIAVDTSGTFQKQGFSPTEYTIVISAPGYVGQKRSVNLQPGKEFNLGTILLELSKKINLEYTGSGLDENNEKTTLEPDERWKPKLTGAWSLSFLQKEGKLSLRSFYAPWYAIDLGEGTLDDFEGIENSARELLNQPPNFEINDGHIYFVKSYEGKWLLFKAKID